MKEIKIKLDTPIRWNSIFIMIDRALEYKKQQYTLHIKKRIQLINQNKLAFSERMNSILKIKIMNNNKIKMQTIKL